MSDKVAEIDDPVPEDGSMTCRQCGQIQVSSKEALDLAISYEIEACPACNRLVPVLSRGIARDLSTRR